MKMMDGLCSRAKLNRFFTNLGGGGRQVFRVSFSYSHHVNIIDRNWVSLFTFTQPLGHKVGGGDGEEGGVVGFCGHRLGQVGFPCTWRAKQKDPTPRSSLSYTNRYCIIKYYPHSYSLSGGLKTALAHKPVKRWGNLMGSMTASFKASLAPSSPATSSHLMFGFSITMAPARRDVRVWDILLINTNCVILQPIFTCGVCDKWLNYNNSVIHLRVDFGTSSSLSRPLHHFHFWNQTRTIHILLNSEHWFLFFRGTQ